MAKGSALLVIPVVGVRDVEVAAHYYRDALGFDLDPETGIFRGMGDEQSGVYAILRRGGAEIHLQIRRLATERPRESIEADVYVRVDDVVPLHEELVERGARITRAPSRAPYGMNEIAVEDLDGTRITFGSPG